MLLLPKKNITNNLKTKRTKLELQDGFKSLEVSFTIHQLSRSTEFLEKDKNNLLLKEKEEMQFHLPHLNLIKKKLIPLKKF